MKKKHIIIGAAFALLGVILDLVVKIVIRNGLPIDSDAIVSNKRIKIIKNFFYIAHVENKGAAWGSFAGKQTILIIISIAILAYFIYLFKNIDFKNKKLFSISLTMVVSGTIGNLIDRLFRRSVTDMFDFYIFGWDFPVFNIADILLVVGFILFAIFLIFFDNEPKKVKDYGGKQIEKENDTEELKQEENNVEADTINTNAEVDDNEGTNRDC